MSSTDVAIDEKIKVVISEPKRWKVILLNDDSTPMEFVISVLTEIFKHTREQAADTHSRVQTLVRTQHDGGSCRQSDQALPWDKWELQRL